MLDEQVSIHGIIDVGEWTALDAPAGAPTDEYNATNVYTETSWGLTAQEGARIVPTVNTVKQRSGQSASPVASFISEADAQLQLRLIDAQVTTLKRLMGLPDTSVTGDLSTPTDEVLIVKGSELGTVRKALYVRTMGPRGPRTYYLPRCSAASLPEQAASRTEYFEPNATFDLYENDAGELYWVKDAAV